MFDMTPVYLAHTQDTPHLSASLVLQDCFGRFLFISKSAMLLLITSYIIYGHRQHTTCCTLWTSNESLKTSTLANHVHVDVRRPGCMLVCYIAGPVNCSSCSCCSLDQLYKSWLLSESLTILLLVLNVEDQSAADYWSALRATTIRCTGPLTWLMFNIHTHTHTYRHTHTYTHAVVYCINNSTGLLSCHPLVCTVLHGVRVCI